MNSGKTIAAVIIGRNEGARLVNCLTALTGEIPRVIYVDSGSTDDSVAMARKTGAIVIELDTSQPFSAARGRNAGIAYLMANDPSDFIQLLDGDCGLEPGWITSAIDKFQTNPDIGIVTGWRSEIYPEASVYNALCDFEWHRPAGDILTCGGDMLVRSAIFESTIFDPNVIAAEDDEFCVRVREQGWIIHRLPENMSRHDADMKHFSQWWQRAIRSGHGFAQVGHLHPGYFRQEQKRVLFYGGLLPILGILAALLAPGMLIAILALYLISYLRTTLGLKTAGLAYRDALVQAVFLTLSKFPNLQGMALFHWRRLRHRHINIIEYK